MKRSASSRRMNVSTASPRRLVGEERPVDHGEDDQVPWNLDRKPQE
jgi:hypothetical protein